MKTVTVGICTVAPMLFAAGAYAGGIEGIQWGASAVTVVQGTTGMALEGDSIEATASLDMEASCAAGDNGLFFVLLEAGAGAGCDGRLESLHGLNAAADDNGNARLGELWYQHSWMDGSVALRAGMVNPGSAGFDGNDVAGGEAEQFLSGAFVNSPVIAFPDNGFGIVATAAPVRMLEIGLALQDAEASWSGIGEAVFGMAELRLTPEIGGLAGNYRVYGWLNGADHQLIASPEEEPAGNSGFGISFDQHVTEAIALFCRYGFQDRSVSRFCSAWSAGAQWSGLAAARPDDVLGVAFGSGTVGDDYAEANPDVPWENEYHGELYYRIGVGGNLAVTPDVQWIRNPGGVSTADDVTALGLRMHLAF